MLRAGYPTLPAWRGRYDSSKLKTSGCYHMFSENGNRVFTNSLALKCINLPFQGMCLNMYIVFTVSQFHADVHSVYLVFDFVWYNNLSESMSMGNVFWWDLKSNESKEHFNFHSPYSLLICSISACSQHQYLLSWLNFCVYHLTCRKKKRKKKKVRTVLQ